MGIDWRGIAIETEKEYSLARGGELLRYNKFDFIFNKNVKYAGDFNRAINLRCDCDKDLVKSITEIENLHKSRELDPPSMIDLEGDPNLNFDDEKIINGMGYHLTDQLFLTKGSAKIEVDSSFEIYSPTIEESIQFLREEQIRFGYYEENYFEDVDIPLHKIFIEKFKPYWLLKDGIAIGSFYLAVVGKYCRLFSVEVKDSFQKRGYGRTLLEVAQTIGYSNGCEYIIVNCDRSIVPFYTSCGFLVSTTIKRLEKR